MIYSSYFLAIGDAKKGGILSLARGMSFIPIVIFLSRLIVLNGIVYSQAIADIIAIIITVFMVIKYKKNAVKVNC